MERITFILLVIIAAYLMFSFFKSRAENVKKEEGKLTEKEKEAVGKEESNEKEKAAIAAAIAAVMGETAFVLKRIYAKATVDERKSNWRIAGRTETMKKIS